MKVELIIPIEGLHGKLRRDGYYFRKYRGQQIVQKCPNREPRKKTAEYRGEQNKIITIKRKEKRKWQRSQ